MSRRFIGSWWQLVMVVSAHKNLQKTRKIPAYLMELGGHGMIRDPQ